MKNEIIPPPLEGKNTNLKTSMELPDILEAKETFKRAYKRMLNPPVWHKVSGFASAKLMLMNSNGEEENRLAQQGDYFRIDILGPGPSLGDGYDWVRVDSIEYDQQAGQDEETYGMTLRPSAPPGKNESDTAHFFKSTATSSFLILRQGNTVTASYHGRNEVPNNNTHSKKDNIRNSLIAMGAFAGLSELQWSALIKGFLEKEIGG